MNGGAGVNALIRLDEYSLETDHGGSSVLGRDQRAVCFAARAVRRPCPPLDDARSASQTARSSRASIR
jgi:hypothetical protein